MEICTLVTENTFDRCLNQLVEDKQKFIGQIMTSKSPVRSAEDIDAQPLSNYVIIFMRRILLKVLGSILGKRPLFRADDVYLRGMQTKGPTVCPHPLGVEIARPKQFKLSSA